ncbi:dynein axonemal intermediate chain 3 isoform X2 [Ascaphus truei]|uniref:dynein axonemal intermediate chain 3 isoform X2 n=1 Tax=Ascaphus truei TaxID=8439 RepID=UPI003F59BADF
MSTRDSSRSPSRASKGSAKRPKSKEKKPGSAKRKGKHSAKKHEDSQLTLASSGHPDYIIPLVLTSKTQEIFRCRVDDDVTQENPFKLVKKEEIVNDLKVRAAVSDFYPFKKLITEYPGDELLIVLDGEFKYGQNFYLVVTEDAKENILHPPEAVTDGEEDGDDADEYAYKPPISKPWISLGSEMEIEEEMVKDTGTKIKYMISRLHREFGSQIHFSDHNASNVKDGYIECASYQDKQFSIKHKEMDTGIQVVPLIQEKSTQTKWTYPRNACTQYKPREFSDEEKNNCLSSKSLKHFINSVSVRLELALQQNEIMNAFFDDWKALAEDESTFGGKSDSNLKEYQSFTDLRFSKNNTISCLNWHPTIHGLVAVSVTERLSFEDRINISSKLLLKPSLILIWSFNDPINPQVVLWDISAYEEMLFAKTTVIKSPSSKTGLEVKVSNEPLFVRYCAVSSIEHGHKNVITDIHWLPDFLELTRTGSPYENKSEICIQLVTCSPDCSVLFWDLRSHKAAVQTVTDKKVMEEKAHEVPQGVPGTFRHLDLTWRPLMQAIIPRTGTSGLYSPIKLSLREEHYHSRTLDKLQTQIKEEKSEKGVNYTNLRVSSAKNPKALEDFNTKFFAGTEDGELVYTDWKLEKDGDTGRLISSKPSQTYVIHDGLVHTVQRSPFFKDIILTVGGWNFAIWREGVTSGPILQSCCSKKRYTAAHWSLSRAGVFFIGKADGNVDIWDLLEKTHEPSQTQNISTTMITYIKPNIASSKQHFLAVADDHGTLHILEIPWTLRHPSPNESANVLHYFEREVKHLGYFEQRKSFRVAEQRELRDLSKKIEIIPVIKSKDQIEEEMSREYKLYLEFEKAVLTELGFGEPEDIIAPTL